MIINNTNLIKMLKKYTNIDKDFIDTFLTKFKINGDLNFDVLDSDVSKYLGITLITLRQRLNNVYSKKKLYFENVDFIKIKVENSNSKIYMLNYPCFERIAMNGDSEQSEVVRLYFVKLRQFLTDNQNVIFQSLNNLDTLKKYNGFSSIYFFAVDERKKEIFKIGRTNKIIERLRNYNVGRIKEIELKYFALVKNPLIIEKCIKSALKTKEVIKNKEMYEIEPEKLKKVIDECYCKNVSKKENDDLYEEISELLGLYSYVRDKVNIKPFIIVDKK
jgi:hypothetical protein